MLLSISSSEIPRSTVGNNGPNPPYQGAESIVQYVFTDGIIIYHKKVRSQSAKFLAFGIVLSKVTCCSKLKLQQLTVPGICEISLSGLVIGVSEIG